MRWKITGIHIDVGDSLQSHVEEELGETLEKYAERPTGANVVFSKDSSEHACEATVHLSTGLTVAAKGRAHEIYAAFEQCRERMEKQLRRYKRRLKNHHRERSAPVELADATSYILDSEGVGTPEPESLQPVIIAEMETRIPSLSVGEAVMQMELADAPVLVFRNEAKDALNVVYRRDDGNVGWIDP